MTKVVIMLFTKLVFSNGKRFGCILCTVAKYFLVSPIPSANSENKEAIPRQISEVRKR